MSVAIEGESKNLTKKAVFDREFAIESVDQSGLDDPDVQMCALLTCVGTFWHPL